MPAFTKCMTRGEGGGGVQTNIVHVKQTPVRVYSGKMHFFLGGGGGQD